MESIPDDDGLAPEEEGEPVVIAPEEVPIVWLPAPPVAAGT
jgi:hypothetical protein